MHQYPESILGQSRVARLLVALALALGAVAWAGAEQPRPAKDAQFEREIAPFLKQNCVRCHGASKPKADFQLHDLSADLTKEKDAVRWEQVLEMVSLGDMPPPKEPQPERAARRRLTQWIEGRLRSVGRGVRAARGKLPAYGNRVNHDDLFSGEHKGPAFSHPRLWRIFPEIYEQRVQELRLNRRVAAKMKSSLTKLDGRGFKDFSIARADAATFSALLTNAEAIAQRVTTGKGAQLGSVNLDADARSSAVERAFHLLLERDPSAEERQRYGQFLNESIEQAGPLRGYQSLIMAILVSGEFVFRMELGLGETLKDGRRMLSPREIAYAVSYAITDKSPDKTLQDAAAEGRLSRRSDVEREVRRLLAAQTEAHWHYRHHQQGPGPFDDPNNPRILRFFREFFGYHRALDVFKDGTHRKIHGFGNPKTGYLIQEADIFVLDIVKRDKEVLRELLTSDRYFVHYRGPKELKKRGNAKISHKDHYIRHYNLETATWQWQRDQPFRQNVPRAGMLTHPAWLMAWSDNFDNDPIRRGKWIREHLLADSVPELPLDVDVNLPTDPHRTLRERLEATRAKECWRCHRQMNPLGVAFESYTDFGVFRERIELGDVLAYREKKESYDRRRAGLEKQLEKWTQQGNNKEVDRLRSEIKKLVAPKPETKPVNDSGVLEGTGDPKLDGPYDGAVELMNRLAQSKRVRQSFLRHMFRYWMGRNEMLSDSPTLMAMDRVYVESGGSFKETLVTLLTSDSFLYRKEKE